mgnify:FL=1
MAINRIDPVAQTFFIKEPTFISKVDLFFSTKDNSLPIFLQIRKNKDGFPTDVVLPFSQKVVQAANVSTSADANTATTVEFSAPVFCDIGDYSLTVGSDSKAYNAYVSELNGTDTLTGRTISEQPLVGSLFLSENLRLYQPDLFEDLKVTIYRAKFSTSVTASVELDLSKGLGASGGGPTLSSISNLESDPLEVYPNIKTMKVYHFNHGLLNASFVRINNVANANILLANGEPSIGNIVGMFGNLIQDVDFTVSNVRFDSYTVNLPQIPNIKKPTRFGGEQVYIEDNIGYSTITPQLSIFKPANTSVNNQVITTTPTTGSTYTIDSAFQDIQNAVENNFDNIKVVASKKNESYKTANATTFRYKVVMNTDNDRVSPIIDTQQLGVNFKRNLVNDPTYAELDAHELRVLSRDGTAGKGGHKANIVALSNTTAVITLQNVRSQENANTLINGTILNVQANTTQTIGTGAYNSGLYRVIDVIDGGLNIKVALVNIANSIISTDEANNNVYSIVSTSDFIAEEAATGGSAFSKYISRQVDFINPSTGVKFFFDVSKPADATVDIFLKTKLAGDTTPMNQVEYTKVSNVTITNSLGGEFVQFQQEVNNLEEFNSLVFKLVLESTDESQIPKIKNLRAIAIQ